MRPLLPLGAVLALSAVGCAVGPDYHREDPALPAVFVGNAEGARTPVAALESWWDLFADPQMSQLVAQALNDNLQMAQSLARLDQARAGVRFARAALLPSASVVGTAAANHASVETPLGKLLNATPNFDRNGEYYELDVAASWELDLFGGQRRAREAAQAGAEAVAADTAAVRLAVVAQTASAYVGLRALQARVAIAQERIDTQATLRDLVAQQFSEGLAARQRLDQEDAALAQLRAAQAPLRASLEATRNALDVLLGQPAGTSRERFAQSAPVPSAPPVGAEETPAQLLRRRPDLIAAERRVVAANARVGQSIAEYYPKVSLSALIGSASTRGAQFLGDSAAQAQGALGLRWRLFDFGRVDASIAAARGQSAEALLAYKLVVLRATEEVESSLSELDQRRVQSRLLADGTAHAAAAREAMQRSLSTGLSSRPELLRAHDQVLQFRDAQVQADAAASFAAIAAYRALGGGWRPDEALVKKADAASVTANAR